MCRCRRNQAVPGSYNTHARADGDVVGGAFADLLDQEAPAEVAGQLDHEVAVARFADADLNGARLLSLRADYEAGAAPRLGAGPAGLRGGRGGVAHGVLGGMMVQ